MSYVLKYKSYELEGNIWSALLLTDTNTAFVYGNMIYFWLEKQQKAQTKWQSGILYKDEDVFAREKHTALLRWAEIQRKFMWSRPADPCF